MRRRSAPSEDQILRVGAAGVGVILMASATLAADLACEHMHTLGTICGAATHPHCEWRLGAASLAVAGLAAFAFAMRPIAGSTPLRVLILSKAEKLPQP